MTPTTTASRVRRSLGILGVALVAVATLASGAIGQSLSPAVSHTPAIASPEAGAATDRGRRIRVCRGVSPDRWQRRGEGSLRGRDRLRPRDMRRAFRDPRPWSDGRAGRPSRVVLPRLLGPAVRASSVSSIEGSTVTLVTPDGWSRAVDTAGVPVTRDGATITPADLRVGDQVWVRQRRADDGSWQVTRIRVLLTTVRGTVASVTADGFELTTPDRGNVSVRVSDATAWVLGCRTADPIAPLDVGARVVARGVSAAGGSLDATLVAAAGPPLRRHVRGQGSDEPSPAPVATPGA